MRHISIERLSDAVGHALTKAAIWGAPAYFAVRLTASLVWNI